mmetsp:Transcript_27246/g.58542  ORF Transcript_27246/g.58542 Transcript_27246/m.58542 type:complete len:157 (-) Transcript_27246:1664-2134(-)
MNGSPNDNNNGDHSNVGGTIHGSQPSDLSSAASTSTTPHMNHLDLEDDGNNGGHSSVGGAIYGSQPPDLSSAPSSSTASRMNHFNLEDDGPLNPPPSGDVAPSSAAAYRSMANTQNEEMKLELDIDDNEEPIVSALQMPAALQDQDLNKSVVSEDE